MQKTNQLIHAASPYLLQHAHNPVDWYEWGAEALQKAQKENKLIVVSIGYSACHWCHVMERESFESEEVAKIMNENFVCIKVDREERPDIDQVYMLALQLMNGSGGWPLNMICLPDQRPVYGGTYFNSQNWMSMLRQLAVLWQQEPQKMLDYASQLQQGLHQAELILPNENQAVFHFKQLEEIVDGMKFELDKENGGYRRAPKFPLPNNWIFLFRYACLTADTALKNEVCFLLEAMAKGGIYDQISGGFARYSVDEKWHVPHFEKMIYDNAQLISLYAEVYQQTKDDFYKQVIVSTIAWAENEMQAANGLFYAALDADSEGEEGKFYTWDKQDFWAALTENQDLLMDYFDVRTHGNWEENQTNILRRLHDDEKLMAKYDQTKEELEEIISKAKSILLKERSKRVRPGLDDKCITAWNALMIKALVDAAQSLNEEKYYQKAKITAQFILHNCMDEHGILYRNYKNGKANIPAFLDDYAYLIDALISLYQYDFKKAWLNEALELTEQVLSHFTDEYSPMFFYTASNSEKLIARKHEVMDNVMPSSNSVMAQNLQTLGLLTDNQVYTEKAKNMLNAVLPRMKSYGSAFSNWSIQLGNEIFGINEIAVLGKDWHKLRMKFNDIYIPNRVFLGGTEANLPLLQDKPIEDKSKIYVCKNHTCQMPVETMEAALQWINTANISSITFDSDYKE